MPQIPNWTSSTSRANQCITEQEKGGLSYTVNTELTLRIYKELKKIKHQVNKTGYQQGTKEINTTHCLHLLH